MSDDDLYSFFTKTKLKPSLPVPSDDDSDHETQPSTSTLPDWTRTRATLSPAHIAIQRGRKNRRKRLLAERESDEESPPHPGQSTSGQHLKGKHKHKGTERDERDRSLTPPRRVGQVLLDQLLSDFR